MVIEDYIVKGIYSVVDYFIMKNCKALERVDEVVDIDKVMLDNLFEMGIRGFIIDVDETLRFAGKKIPLVNKEWLDMVRERFKVVILSNGRDDKINKYFKSKGIDYIYFATKPLKKGFNRALTSLKLKPEEVVIIGNDSFSDLYGATRNNMKCVLVKKRKVGGRNEKTL